MFLYQLEFKSVEGVLEVWICLVQKSLKWLWQFQTLRNLLSFLFCFSQLSRKHFIYGGVLCYQAFDILNRNSFPSLQKSANFIPDFSNYTFLLEVKKLWFHWEFQWKIMQYKLNLIPKRNKYRNTFSCTLAGCPTELTL